MGIKDSQTLSISCSVEERNEISRTGLVRRLERFGITPTIDGDVVKFDFKGERKTVVRLASCAEAHCVHSIKISSGA